jgi:hypothetical protein
MEIDGITFLSKQPEAAGSNAAHVGSVTLQDYVTYCFYFPTILIY